MNNTNDNSSYVNAPNIPGTANFIERRSIPADKRAFISEVADKPARPVYINSPRQKVSQRILLAQRTDFTTVVCSDSGISSCLQIPAIPNYALSYSHPLSDISNARGVAQQGLDYLRKLDSQTLAGILIILANDYDLFRYQPADSGAQKNAILRTAGKDCLVKTILVIEDTVHSNNYSYLPKLSLILDSTVQSGGISSRIEQWLKLIIEAVYKPDIEAWDENSTVASILKKQTTAATKEQRIQKSNEFHKQKQLRADCKQAQIIIKNLFRTDLISGKFKMFLQNIFADINLVTIEAGAKFLLVGKLEGIDSTDAKRLIEILDIDRSGLTTQRDIMNEFLETDKTASEEVYVIKNNPDTGETVRVLSIELPTELEEGKIRIFLAGKAYTVDASYNTLSFIDKIKMNKLLLAQSA